ncbi:MAG: hypothetical protein AAF851_13610 [Myxococcota bacterium]
MRIAVLMLVPVVCGCGGLDPQVGDLVNARCRDEDSNPDRDVSFREDVMPLILGERDDPGCGCHLPNEPDPIGFTLTGLDLSSYEDLLQGGANSGGSIVVPGSPCASILWQKTGSAPPFGARMPFDGPPFLSPAARRLVADWIAEGANDD